MFYDVFERLCKERHVAPSALARKLKMSPSAPGRWKTGSYPDLETASKIADYFGVSIDFLLERDEVGHNVAASDHSTVAMNNSGTVATNGASISQGPAEQLSDMEMELLRIFRGLDMRKKNALMSQAYDMEDTMRKEG